MRALARMHLCGCACIVCTLPRWAGYAREGRVLPIVPDSLSSDRVPLCPLQRPGVEVQAHSALGATMVRPPYPTATAVRGS